MIISLGGRSLKVEVGRVVKHDPEVRGLVAAMARSEVKNYLADLAEQAGVPFSSAEGFITHVTVASKMAAAGTGRPGRDSSGKFTRKGM